MDSGHLAKIPLFAGLTLDQRDLVAGACSELEVEEGATLLKEGDFGYAMFAITAGTADVLRDGVVIRTLGSGDVFGEIAVLSGGRRYRRRENFDVPCHRAQSRRVAAGAGGARGRRRAPRENRRASRARSTAESLERLDLDLEERVGEPVCAGYKRRETRSA